MFLLLPPEIRWEIYSYLYTDESPIDIVYPFIQHRKDPPLFKTCRQLHNEALMYYYSRNVEVLLSLDMPQSILAKAMVRNDFRMVRKLRIVAHYSQAHVWRCDKSRPVAFGKKLSRMQRRLDWLIELMHSIEVEMGSLKLADVKITHWQEGFKPAMQALEDLTGHRPRLHIP